MLAQTLHDMYAQDGQSCICPLKVHLEKANLVSCVEPAIEFVSERVSTPDVEEHPVTGLRAVRALLATCRKCLPVKTPGQVVLQPQEYMAAFETTLLNSCLPGRKSTSGSQWQNEAIASYLGALAKLIARFIEPIAKTQNLPEWKVGELNFFGEPEFWKRQLYRSLAAAVAYCKQNQEMRDCIGSAETTTKYVPTPPEVLLEFHFHKSIGQALQKQNGPESSPSIIILCVV